MDETSLVMLVEDNEDLNSINKRALAMAGYETVAASTLKEARELLKTHNPRVILLDVLLPDGNGMDFCREIRSGTGAHILFLTSRTEHEEMLRGLNVGGDDYITKPYRLDELITRVGAAMRRQKMELAAPPTIMTKGPLRLELVSGRAFLSGEDMLLTPKEFAVLLVLAQNEGRALTTEQLYDAVWKQPMGNNAGSLWKCISRLKKKLSPARASVQLNASRGEGYCLEVDQ